MLGGNHPLLKLDNAICTPHLGYVEQGTYESYFGTAIDADAGVRGGQAGQCAESGSAGEEIDEPPRATRKTKVN